MGQAAAYCQLYHEFHALSANFSWGFPKIFFSAPPLASGELDSSSLTVDTDIDTNQASGHLASDPPTLEDLDYAAELLSRVQHIYRSAVGRTPST